MMEHITHGTANHNMEDGEVQWCVCVCVFLHVSAVFVKALLKLTTSQRLGHTKQFLSFKKNRTIQNKQQKKGKKHD